MPAWFQHFFNSTRKNFIFLTKYFTLNFHKKNFSIYFSSNFNVQKIFNSSIIFPTTFFLSIQIGIAACTLCCTCVAQLLIDRHTQLNFISEWKLLRKHFFHLSRIYLLVAPNVFKNFHISICPQESDGKIKSHGKTSTDTRPCLIIFPYWRKKYFSGRQTAAAEPEKQQQYTKKRKT